MAIVYKSKGPLLDLFKFINARCTIKVACNQTVAKIGSDKRIANNEFDLYGLNFPLALIHPIKFPVLTHPDEAAAKIHDGLSSV